MWDFGKVCWRMMLALAWKGDSRDFMESADCGVLRCHGSETMMGVTILASKWRVAPRKCVSGTSSN